MAYTHTALALVWLVIFGLFALSGSGMMAGSGILLLVVAALVTPALIFALFSKPRGTMGSFTAQERASAVPGEVVPYWNPRDGAV